MYERPPPQRLAPVAALLTLAQSLSAASMVLAVKCRSDGTHFTLASHPALPMQDDMPAWRGEVLPASDSDWLPLEVRHLSSALRLALPFTPAALRYLDCSAASEHARGGLLLIWGEAPGVSGTCAQLTSLEQPDHAMQSLRSIYGQLLDLLYLRRIKKESGTQFQDIFDSVSLGVVVIDGDGVQARLNRAASLLLQAPAGDLPVQQLADLMHLARSNCDNANEIEQAYARLQHELDAEILIDWRLHGKVLRVDTHPIRGDGQHGRVWLFDDVTTQLLMEEVLRRDASLDVLTGLLNRRALYEQGRALFQASQETRTAVTVVMLDIDHFKQINDHYGHPVGDQVLKTMAKRLSSSLQEEDILGRYGGEEFMFILEQITPDVALRIAERVRHVVSDTLIRINTHQIACTISLGVACAMPGDVSLEALIERADQCLYQAKRQGRNRVVISPAA